MWDGELGTDGIFYHRNLKEIIPRLKSLSSKKYAEYVKIFYKGAYNEPEIDEDVHAIMSDLVQSIGEKLEVEKPYEFPKQSAFYKPNELEYDIYYPGSGSSTPLWVTDLTDYGLFEKEVNLAYSKISKAGFVRYGRQSNKEKIIFFIILVLSVNSKIDLRIVDGIPKEDFDKVAKGMEHFYIKTGKPIRELFRETVSDEHKYTVFSSGEYLQKMTASLIPRVTNDIADIKCPYCGASLNEDEILISNNFSAIWELKGKALDRKLIEYEGEAKRAGKKIRPYELTTLINLFYCARFFENKVGMKVFRENPKLQKIWSIPRKTWTDKWNLLASLDEKL